MRVTLGLGTVLALVLLGAAAGCLAADEDPVGPESSPQGEVPLGAESIDVDKLTEDAYEIQEKRVEYVTASTPDAMGDEVQLYVEIYEPDGEGPWPVILESSPYYAMRANGELEDVFGHSLVGTYVPKGYAVVLAHVRGTGNSEGCMDMMGPREQADQVDLVEWAAQQPFSDGNVAMHGFSYVGTTPHEAAIHDPDGLEAIITGAGVTNQWRNTFQNGVPYQGRHYPITYQATSGTPPPTDVDRGPAWALNAAKNACGQEDALQEMSPGTYEKGLYTEYWDERNLTKGAQDVTVPLLYTQGFSDRAVNPMEALDWFNEIDAPKKGLFHQEGHTYPPREDYATIEHAWIDRWLKGIENGVTEGPTVEVQTNHDTVRPGDAWPPQAASTLQLNVTPAGELTTELAPQGEATYLADMARNPTVGTGASLVDGTPLEETYHDPAAAIAHPSQIEWSSAPLEEPAHVAGPMVLHLNASVDAENTYFLFDVYDEDPSGERTWLAEGWFNAHLRDGFDQSAPLTPGEAYRFTITFEPREWILDEEHRLVLRVTGHDDRVFPIDEPATVNTVHMGPEGTWLEVPLLEDASVVEETDAMRGGPPGQAS